MGQTDMQIDVKILPFKKVPKKPYNEDFVRLSHKSLKHQINIYKYKCTNMKKKTMIFLEIGYLCLIRLQFYIPE